MKQTIASFLKVKDFPFSIKDKNGNQIYRESSNGYWYKRELDNNGNEIYYEDSNGFWEKHEYDDKGNEIYYEDLLGTIIVAVRRDNRPRVIEMTLQQIADKLGVDVKNIRIKD